MESHILLVEDNPGDRRLIQEALREASDSRFKLDSADRLATGLEKLRAGKPDAVLLDLSLPDSQGLETFARVHALAPGVPIVVLTGLKDEEVALQAVRAGAQDYLLKDEIVGGLLVRALLYAMERKRAEAALKAERQRLFEVLETLPTMICLLTPDYHVAFANRSFREKFGQANGRHCYEYCYARTEPCDFCESFEVLKTGQPRHWEVTTPDGTVIDVHDFPFTDVDGSPMILQMDIDITERKRAQEALRKSHEELELRVKERTAELREANERLQVELAERQRAEEAALRAKQDWERTFDAVPDLIAIIDGQHRILRANRAMAERLGKTPEQCAGATCYHAVHGMDHPPAVCPHVCTLADGKEHLAELSEVRLGGDFLVSTTPLTDAEGKTFGSVHVARDITERKRAEGRMAADLAALKRMHALSERVLGPQGLPPLLQEVMDAAVAIMGAERGTLQVVEGSSLRILAHHGHQPRFLEFFSSAENRASVCGEAMHRQERVVVPDIEKSPLFAGTLSLPVLRQAGVRAVQSTPMVSRRGALLGVLTTHWSVPHSPDPHDLWRIDLLARQTADLIERAQGEEALRASEQRFRVLSEAMPQMVWSTDATGAIDYINPRTLEYAGKPTSDIHGWNWQSLLHPEDLAATVPAWRHAVTTGEPYRIEHRIRRADGEFRWHLTAAVPVRDASGLVVRWIGTATDIHDQKLAEQILERRVQERTAELGRLNRALRTLSECNQALVRAQDEPELLREVCRLMVEVGGYRLAWVGVAEQDEDKTVRPVAFVGVEEGYLETLKITWADTERGRGPTGTALRTGKLSVCRNILEDPRLAPWRGEATRRGYASSIALPLILEGRPGAALMLYSQAPDAFDRNELELLEELANDLAYGIQAIRNRAARVQAEELAREQFKLAEAFFNHNLSCLVMLDRNYNFVRVNQAYAQACRKEIRDFTGKNHFEMYPSDTKLIFDDVLRTKNSVSIFARQFVFPDQPERGATYWDWTLVPLLDQQGEVEYLLFSLNEVTGRKRAEEALRESQQRIDLALESGQMGAWDLDLVHDAAVRSLRHDQIFGYPVLQPEWGAEIFLEHVVPADRDRIRAAFQEARASGLLDIECQITRADGAARWIAARGQVYRDPKGTPVRMLGVVSDITERKRAEEILKAERQRFNDLLNELPAYVVLLTPDYHVSFANRTFRERFGESNGKHCYEFLFGRSEPCDTCETYKVLKTQKPHHWEWTGPDGRDYTIADFPFTETDGSTLILEMGIDVTERKRAEEEILRLSRRLLQAQEDERRRLARELHDSTAQGLAAIAINLSVVQGTARMNEQGRKCLDSAIEVAKECSEEIRNLSHLLHPPMLEQMGLPAALSWYIERFHRRTRIKVDLHVSPDFGRLPKEAEIALYRIVQEGLTNVFRHSGSPRAKVELLADSAGIFLQVADEGMGLGRTGSERHEHGDTRRGVGISSMRERVRQLGGLFEIASSSQGTTVHVTLPCERR